jgi:hypothetical protein
MSVVNVKAKREKMTSMKIKVVVLAIFAAMASSAAAAPTSALSCADGGTTTRTGSGYRIVYCGPAVATLRIGKTTYAFKNGSCFDANGNGLFMFSGTEVIANDEIANVADGSGSFIWIATTKQGSGVVAYDGTHPLVSGSPNTIKTASTGPTGTFTGRSKSPSKPISSGSTFAFSGTWSCNGTVHSWADYVANVNRPQGG